jgi:hypothetical protein
MEGRSSLELNRTNIGCEGLIAHKAFCYVDHHAAVAQSAKAELNQPATTAPRPSSKASIA